MVDFICFYILKNDLRFHIVLGDINLGMNIRYICGI